MPAARGRSVLVIDDDPEMRMVIEEMLTKRHYKVITAYNGLDAIKKSNKEKVDAILLDICMPVFSGYWFCDVFRKRPKTRHVPVIVMSVLSEDSDIKRAYQVGACAYLRKPFGADELVRAIESQFAEQQNT